MSDKQERLLAYLARAEGWVTAAELADRLGVTSRSVRSYVTSLKALAAPLEVIASSTSGYRLDRESYARFLAARRSRDAVTETPHERVYHIVRTLADAADGTDVVALSDGLFVSVSTIESDLRRVRAELEGTGLVLARHENAVRIEGSEGDLRRLLSRMFRDEGTQGFLEIASIEREFASSDLSGVKTDLIAMLDSHGYFVNEYGINNVLLHLAIALERLGKGDTASPPLDLTRDASVTDVATELSALVTRHFGVVLGEADVDYLTRLLTTRVITRGHTGDDVASAEPDGPSRALVRRIVATVAQEYLVDLDDEEFIVRLSLHVDNLIARAKESAYSRNPMSRSLKTAYPMIYELAVFIASEIQRHESIVINDDEISYIALHVGSYLERQSHREERVTCAIVCPNYYDVALTLRARIEATLGSDLQVSIVITRTDVEWAALATDLVLTTITDAGLGDDVVIIQPFLTENDVEAIRRAIARVRRGRRRTRLKDELLQFFDASLFERNLHAADEAEMITVLGERMMRAGIIGQDYVEGALARERLSSTAFTDNLAVPHALAMTATRTAICIVVNESPMDWGGARVNVIALIAFSASDRTTFQAIFDQFVSVFADRDDVQRIIRNAVDFPSFIEELVTSVEL
ncbi:MAG: hypothetical protein RI885_1000 [Actinomycetota bacterium]